MRLFCLDLEGVLIPEIWIGLAERTGIDALRATTRDVPDYDALMRPAPAAAGTTPPRAARRRGGGGENAPLPGARDFLRCCASSVR